MAMKKIFDETYTGDDGRKSRNLWYGEVPFFVEGEYGLVLKLETCPHRSFFNYRDFHQICYNALLFQQILYQQITTFFIKNHLFPNFSEKSK